MPSSLAERMLTTRPEFQARLYRILVLALDDDTLVSAIERMRDEIEAEHEAAKAASRQARQWLEGIVNAPR